MPFVGLQCVIVVFPDHTHLLSGTQKMHVRIANWEDPDQSDLGLGFLLAFL